ncbi:hypothetical protein GCM10018966_085460 [Streptomyces yanii]
MPLTALEPSEESGQRGTEGLAVVGPGGRGGVGEDQRRHPVPVQAVELHADSTWLCPAADADPAAKQRRAPMPHRTRATPTQNPLRSFSGAGSSRYHSVAGQLASPPSSQS